MPSLAVQFPLTKKGNGTDGATFMAKAQINSEAVRRQLADADVVTGEIMRKPVTLAAALDNHAKDGITGTISVTFNTDPEGNVRRRTKITDLQITKTDGTTTTRKTTQVLERRLISR